MVLAKEIKARAPRQWWILGVFVVLIPLVLFPTLDLLAISAQGSGGSLWSAYVNVFTDPNFWQSVEVTYQLALISTVVAAVLGLLISIALYFSQLKVAGIFMRSIELIIAFPSFLIAFSLIYLYGSQGAVTVGVEQLFHLHNVSFHFLYGFGGIILAEVTYYIPFMIRPTVAVLELLDGTLLEAASVLGANPLRILRRVVMPLTRAGIAAGIILCFLFIQNEFGILLVLGTLAVPTLPIAIYSDATINLDLQRAAVEATFMMVTSLCLYGLYRRIMRRASDRLFANTARSAVGTAFLGRPGAGVAPGVGAMGLVAILFLLPAVVVYLSAFSSSWTGTILPSSYTLRWFTQLDASDWSTLWTSLWVGLSVATISVIISTVAARFVTRATGAIGQILDFLLMVPNTLPSVVLGLAVLLAYHAQPFYLADSPLIVIIAQVALTLPFCYRTILAALLKQPPDYAEAAAGLGPHPGARSAE